MAKSFFDFGEEGPRVSVDKPEKDTQTPEAKAKREQIRALVELVKEEVGLFDIHTSAHFDRLINELLRGEIFSQTNAEPVVKLLKAAKLTITPNVFRLQKALNDYHKIANL